MERGIKPLQHSTAQTDANEYSCSFEIGEKIHSAPGNVPASSFLLV